MSGAGVGVGAGGEAQILIYLDSNKRRGETSYLRRVTGDVPDASPARWVEITLVLVTG